MSMLSAQCDELRAMAESVGLEVPQAATLMMGAADTIDALGAENAKLRSELESVGTAAYLYGRSDLKAENDRLRELAVLNWEWAHSCCGNSCKVRTEGCGYGIDRECNYEREIWDRMRELGVEVER